MTTTVPTPIDVSGTTPTPFHRLVRVELRKSYDTRAGFWLLLITGLLLVVTVGLVLLVIALNDGVSIGAGDWAQVLTIPVSLLLPVFAIHTVTSEWSQRTGLVTFTLEPRRGRVLAAKATTVAILALATIVIVFFLGVVGSIVGASISGTDVDWGFGGAGLVMLVVNQLFYFFMAFGLATVMLNTPSAIAFFYVVALLLPLMVYSFLYAAFDWARATIPWIDLQYASAPFADWPVSGLDIVRLFTAVLLWLVFPLLGGVRRVLRSELE